MTKALDQRAPEAAAPAQLFYSPRQVAEMLALDIKTVYLETRSGRLESVKYGRRVLIPDDALKAFIAELRGRSA
jgi:excisionase family DNA binding protein